MVENYLGAPAPENAMQATQMGLGDTIVEAFITIFLRGKFFALFSFLFGLSFFIQMDKAHMQGRDFKGRFLWRLIILLVIGYLHHLFYRGDILTIYAILGIFLIPFYTINNKVILGFVVLLFFGMGRYLGFLMTQGDSFFFNEPVLPQSADVITYFDIIKNGTLKEVIVSNATQGHLMKADFQLGVFGRGYLTFGFFLLGLLVGRTHFFQNFMDKRKLVRKILWWSLLLFVVSIGLTAFIFIQLGENARFDNWLAMFGLTAFDLNNIAMTFVITCLFVLAYGTVRGGAFLRKFNAYGRMALTNYVFQSLIGTFILFGWGLDYLGELRSVYTLLIAVVLILVQMGLSNWWLRKFYYGPLEWLWRSLTYFKWYPIKKV